MKLFHGLDEDDADDDAGGDEQSLPSAFLDRLHAKLATSVSQRGIVAQLIHERSHFPGVEPKMQRLGSLAAALKQSATHDILSRISSTASEDEKLLLITTPGELLLCAAPILMMDAARSLFMLSNWFWIRSMIVASSSS